MRLREGASRLPWVVWLVAPQRPGEGGFDEGVLKPGDSILVKIDPPSLRSCGETGAGREHSRALVLCMSANTTL